MKYGYFDDSNCEYVITRPDTPRPWSNYLGSRRYGGIITNNAGGYSFTRSPASGRIIRHRYNSIPQDMPGRVFYILDRESRDYWSAAWQPVGKPLSEYKTETRFGPGYAVISSQYADIATEATYFMPLDTDHEIWRLKIRNLSNRPRPLSVISFCEFTTEWNLGNDLLNLQYTQYIARADWDGAFIQASSCAHLPEDPDNFANRDQARYWWMSQQGGSVVGFDGDRDGFIGPYGDFRSPAALTDPEHPGCRNSVGLSDNICGAIQSDMELQPDEEREVLVVVGIGRANHAGAEALAELSVEGAVDEQLAILKDHWRLYLSAFQCESPDPDFDHMVNVWGAWNALMTFEWSRSCSLVYTGESRDGFGFRDTVQDCLGVTAMMPADVRERLILMLSAQDACGGAQPEVRAWSHKPGQMKPTPPHEYRSDDCLWFFNAIPAYVAESGDTGFYDIVVPYADESEATVMGHLRRALEFNLERTGANGLPCGLLADWNDALKLGFHGESIFVAFQVRLGLTVYADLARDRGEKDEAAWADSKRHTLDEAIQHVCWDGEWFRWAIAQDGTVFGTKDYPEGQVYLNTQAWAVLSGAATPEQTQLALDTVKDRLSTEWGVAMCAPPFEKTPVEVMRAVLFNPGTKENGGIFSHTQSWAVLAEIERGDGDLAYQYYRSFMPAAQNDRADIREIEPFVHCQSTHSAFSGKFGRSRVPWLSGTASWSHYTATNFILGIQPEAGGLRINPCIPSSWDVFKVTRRVRGKTIHIEVRNPNHHCSGVKRVTVNGDSIPGDVVPESLLQDGAKIVAEL